MNVTDRIKQLAGDRGWSEYRLVKESGLATSTIANIYHRNTIPGIPTLEVLCNTFGITLSQFFCEDEPVALSTEQKQLLEHWARLTEDQRKVLLQLLETLF